MDSVQRCPECGAIWDGKTCQDDFGQMLSWEAENPGLGEVHHLMVLCYYLQHPSLYSPEGLTGARELLTEFMERGISPSEARKRNRDKVDSGRRQWNIKGTPERHGEYGRFITWELTASDVTAKGVDNYCAMVKNWARSVHAILKRL